MSVAGSLDPSLDHEMDSNQDDSHQQQQNDQDYQRRRKALPVHRCRFPDWSPSPIAAIAITPTSFDTALLNFGGQSTERGLLAVGRANGDVELMCWGGHQGWVAWRTLPSSFQTPPSTSNGNGGGKRPLTLLSHLTFTHQLTLSPSDLKLYDGDLSSATVEIERLKREGVRLFGVGGVSSELVEWEWGGPGAKKEVGRIKATLPSLPPIFALAASRTSSHLAIGCEDSTIRIINILDDELEQVARIDVGGPGRVRALSLAWGPPAESPSMVGVSLGKGKTREGSPSDDVSSSSLPAHFATPTEPYLIAGCSNSSIRRFDSPLSSSNGGGGKGGGGGTWKPTHRMTLDQLKGEKTVVWSVVVLEDGTVVSGDSMGNVKFWDGKMGTQTQSFRAHKADVLCLTVGSTGTSLFTSGVDQKTTEFRLVSVSSSKTQAGRVSRWIQASGRRMHSHDVRAMIISPPYALPIPNPSPLGVRGPGSRVLNQVPIITSGGLDLSLIIVAASPIPSTSTSIAKTNPNSKTKSITTSTNPLSINPISDSPTEFETTIHRRAAYVPQRTRPFVVAHGDVRLLVCRRARSVGVWKLEDPKGGAGSLRGVEKAWRKRREMFGIRDEEEEEEEEEEGEEEEKEGEEGGKGWKKVLEMVLKLQTNLVASAISDDGKWLAVADLYETKLFKLSWRDGELVPRRQKTFSTALSSSLPSSLGTGSSNLAFTPDSSKLVLSTSFSGVIAIIELPTGKEEVFVVDSVFGEHGRHAQGEREIRGVAVRTGANGKLNGVANGVNGHSHDDDDDDDDDEDDEDEDEEMEDGSVDATPAFGVLDKPATVVLLAISSDGKWLASADLERKVCVFDLERKKLLTTLPTPSHVPSALTFLPPSPLNEPTLIFVLPTNSISLFSLTSLRFLPWAVPLSTLTSNTLMDLREPVLGITFEPRIEAPTHSSKAKVHESRLASLWSDQLAVLWGANWVAKVDLDEVRNNSAAPTKNAPVRREADRKRARDEDGEPSKDVVKVDIRTTRRYQPLVLFDFVGQGELVAVERVWWDLAKDLPEAWAQSSRFGS
ncbi:WD40 repeat-like protein [Meredithblackwellia eburnea MCA 4105]